MTTQATNTRTVTIDIPDAPTDSVIFTLYGLMIVGAEIIEETEAYTVALDASGVGSVDLPTADATGDSVAIYQVLLPNGQEYMIELLYDASSIALATLIAAGVTQMTADAIVTYMSGLSHTTFADIGTNTHAQIDTHIADETNPHSVTAAQAGADVAGSAAAAQAASLPLVGGVMGGTIAMNDNRITQPIFTDYGETLNAIGSIGGGTQDINIALANVVSGTVDTSTTTFTFSNPSASGVACSFTLFLTNGGSQTVNWPASVDWAGGTAPELTAAGVDILTFVTLDAGTIWYGFAAGLDMQ
jgi:hypothetical protein